MRRKKRKKKANERVSLRLFVNRREREREFGKMGRRGERERDFF